MKVLGYLLARLGIRLVWAVVEFVANWSLDTVNTIPLVQSPGRNIRRLPSDRNKQQNAKNIA